MIKNFEGNEQHDFEEFSLKLKSLKATNYRRRQLCLKALSPFSEKLSSLHGVSVSIFCVNEDNSVK